MKKAWIALALSLTMMGSLAACGRDGTDISDTGSASGSNTEQASRRRTSAVRRATDPFYQDGQYAAGEDGRVRDSGTDRTHDLEQDLRDMMRDAGDAAKDAGDRVGSAARDIGNGMENAVRDVTGKE